VINSFDLFLIINTDMNTLYILPLCYIRSENKPRPLSSVRGQAGISRSFIWWRSSSLALCKFIFNGRL